MWDPVGLLWSKGAHPETRRCDIWSPVFAFALLFHIIPRLHLLPTLFFILLSPYFPLSYARVPFWLLSTGCLLYLIPPFWMSSVPRFPSSFQLFSITGITLVQPPAFSDAVGRRRPSHLPRGSILSTLPRTLRLAVQPSFDMLPPAVLAVISER